MEHDLDLSKTFLGIVESNNDPEKMGRCRIRVLDIFDNIPIDDIPWATPQKDLNGNQFILPDVGKVVSVVFDNDNLYTPEYRYSQHYNINLDKKLKDLSNGAYVSMRALIFDHKTQIFSNDDDGLMMDYKFNQINITNNDIDINLKDSNGSINIGTPLATQQTILGNNFLNWFDEFVDNLLGSNGGPYVGNLTAPVIPNPTFIQNLLKYKAMKDPKFLSHNVNVVDNGYIDKVERISDGQIGDTWKSTIEENNKVSRESVEFKPENKRNYAPDGTLTESSDPTNPNVVSNDSDLNQEPPKGEVNPDIKVLLELLRYKGYIIYDKKYQINTIGVRYQYHGDEYSDKFKDRLYAIWKDDTNNWRIKYWMISTIPGLKASRSDRPKTLKKAVGPSRGGMGILKPAQYVDVYEIRHHSRSSTVREARAMGTKGKQLAYRDQDYNSTKINMSKEDPSNAKGGKNFGMLIHKAYSTPNAKKNSYGVQNWSEGCQVFADPKSLNQYFDLCEVHKKKYGNSFTYTLVTSKDVENAENRLKSK